MNPNDSNKPLISFCNDCMRETNHNLLGNRRRKWEDFDENGTLTYYEDMLYEFVQCMGCGNISLRRTCTACYLEKPEIDYFPPAASRRRPSWMSGLKFRYLGGPQYEIRQVLEEVYSAFFSGSYRIALMGARAIIDIALNDKLGDIGGFSKKLQEAENRRWITPSHKKILIAAVDAGNAANHRAYRPEKAQLERILDIVEHLVQTLYILELDAVEISKMTPRRLKTRTKKPRP